MRPRWRHQLAMRMIRRLSSCVQVSVRRGDQKSCVFATPNLGLSHSVTGREVPLLVEEDTALDQPGTRVYVGGVMLRVWLLRALRCVAGHRGIHTRSLVERQAKGRVPPLVGMSQLTFAALDMDRGHLLALRSVNCPCVPPMCMSLLLRHRRRQQPRPTLPGSPCAGRGHAT